MRVKRFANKVVARAPAKINLFLEVLGKRPDGYHEIATLMVAIRLFDTLIAQEDSAGQLTLQCSRADLSTGPDNLVMRAGALLKDRTGCSKGASLSLTKRIPMQAGLGGGSSDAAATLLTLNVLWQLGLNIEQLSSMGAELGSDVPFFLHGAAAWCTGRGERVQPLKLGRRLDIVLFCPAFGCSTAEVYRRVGPVVEPQQGEMIRRALVEGEIGTLGCHLFNRLEQPAVELAPALDIYLQRIGFLEPAGQRMSGSGSTLFALCNDAEQARFIAKALAPVDEVYKVYAVTSCSSQFSPGRIA